MKNWKMVSAAALLSVAFIGVGVCYFKAQQSKNNGQAVSMESSSGNAAVLEAEPTEPPTDDGVMEVAEKAPVEEAPVIEEAPVLSDRNEAGFTAEQQAALDLFKEDKRLYNFLAAYIKEVDYSGDKLQETVDMFMDSLEESKRPAEYRNDETTVETPAQTPAPEPQTPAQQAPAEQPSLPAQGYDTSGSTGSNADADTAWIIENGGGTPSVPGQYSPDVVHPDLH